jgi:formate/nitrite transporter FocA (FNT family)
LNRTNLQKTQEINLFPAVFALWLPVSESQPTSTRLAVKFSMIAAKNFVGNFFFFSLF